MFGTKLDQLKLTTKQKYVDVKDGDNVTDTFTKIFTGPNRDKGIDPDDDVYEQNSKKTGGWGGSCKCPSGKTYWVGDNWNSCKSIGCVGGIPGKCKKRVHRKWLHKHVTCAQKKGQFAFMSSYFDKGHS